MANMFSFPMHVVCTMQATTYGSEGPGRPGMVCTGRPQADVIELKDDVLPGGFWRRLTPAQPLEFGEYALVEVLDHRAINGDVWDFGVHPTAKENDEALRPEPKRPVQLERRGR